MTRGELKFRKSWDEFQKGRKWIYTPVVIIEDSELSAQAKILFTIINSYCKKYGICHASNETLCRKVSLKKTMLKGYLKELKESQLIAVKLTPAHKWKRQITIDFDGLMNRYPLSTIKHIDKIAKAFLSPYPLEKHPDYETIKSVYKCRKAGDKYLYYRPQDKK